MAYTYRMVQVPPSIVVQENAHQGNEAAAYLQTIVNEESKAGWEFYRVDQVGVETQPGCIDGLLGHKAEYKSYYVVTFRKGA